MTRTEFDVEQAIDEIEREIRQQPQLTDKQRDDIRAMYERMRRASDSGDHEEARRTKALCMSAISQGPPDPE